MHWKGVQRLIVPAALSVTSLAVIACGSEENAKKKVDVLSCTDVPDGGCQRCTQPDGGIDCVGRPSCYYDSIGDRCDDAVS